jgi:membrane-bound serine protease (ClpP class)
VNVRGVLARLCPARRWRPWAAAASLALGLALAPTAHAASALVVEVDGPIGPATSDYITTALRKAAEGGAEVVILRMDTPGGLVDSTRIIIQQILAAPVPVVTWVAPGGARAASAGTYILYASHIAAMAPATNVGAATPVQIGGFPPLQPQPEKEEEGKEGDQERPPRPAGMEDKIVHDAAAYMRGLAQLRGRNAEWAEKAVREAVSVSANEALELGVVDLVAADLPALLRGLDGRRVKIGEEERVLRTEGIEIVRLAPDWRTELLSILTNPNVAYLLLLIGIYGIILEFYNPGTFVPGVIGAISLLLALYAFHVLPVSYAGLALIALGVAMMVGEAMLPSFGALGLGGIVAFVVGSVMLLDTDAPGFGVSWELIGAVALSASLLLMLMMTMLARSHRRATVTGMEAMPGQRARVVDWAGNEGHVRLMGETWRARGPAALRPGGTVRVRAVDGLTLEVEPEAPERS